ncbi:MAG: hypothetical protein AAF191_11135 [Verrucomicrobiota bacterium]
MKLSKEQREDLVALIAKGDDLTEDETKQRDLLASIAEMSGERDAVNAEAIALGSEGSGEEGSEGSEGDGGDSPLAKAAGVIMGAKRIQEANRSLTRENGELKAEVSRQEATIAALTREIEEVKESLAGKEQEIEDLNTKATTVQHELAGLGVEKDKLPAASTSGDNERLAELSAMTEEELNEKLSEVKDYTERQKLVAEWRGARAAAKAEKEAA